MGFPGGGGGGGGGGCGVRFHDNEGGHVQVLIDGKAVAELEDTNKVAHAGTSD